MKETLSQKPLEIERKFLVTKIPENLSDFPSSEITQGYLLITPIAEIRIRNRSGICTITNKSGKGQSRIENERKLTLENFNRLSKKVQGELIEKTRYLIPYQNNTIELDIYAGNLKGLIVAEIEFNSEEDAANFLPPDWLDAEVTNDESFKNKSLAIKGLPQNPRFFGF